MRNSKKLMETNAVYNAMCDLSDIFDMHISINDDCDKLQPLILSGEWVDELLNMSPEDMRKAVECTAFNLSITLGQEFGVAWLAFFQCGTLVIGEPNNYLTIPSIKICMKPETIRHCKRILRRKDTLTIHVTQYDGDSENG